MNNSKVKEKLLKDLKKANKDRKLKLAESFGFKTVKDYEVYLTEKESVVVETDETLDYVIAFDTTGSMSSYIASVRKHVEDLINELFDKTPNLKIKLIAFGDYCDRVDFQYQTTELTDNRDKLIKFVKTAQNTSGGDSDEFYELVIKKVVEETPWRDGKRAFLLIGDANPHSVGYKCNGQTYNIDWREEAKKAKEANIQIDTLRIHSSYNWYKELSDITGGVCMEFQNAEKISNIIQGTIYARGNKDLYTKTYAAVVDSGDKELIGAYKTISTLI